MQIEAQQQKKKPTPEELVAALDAMSEVLFGKTGPNQRLAANVLINGNGAHRVRELFQSRWAAWSEMEPKRQAAMEKLLGAIEATGTSLTKMMMMESESTMAQLPSVPSIMFGRWGVVFFGGGTNGYSTKVTFNDSVINGVVSAKVKGKFLSLKIDMSET